jgi:hypothetical protein
MKRGENPLLLNTPSLRDAPLKKENPNIIPPQNGVAPTKFNYTRM